jgi:hypothetical protein
MTSAPAWEDMSALGGTRTPNLLIRKSGQTVRGLSIRVRVLGRPSALVRLR